MTPIEKTMFKNIKRFADAAASLGFPKITIEPQKPIGPYRVDFLVYANRRKVVVECDGHDFHEKTKEQVARDKKRDRFLQKNYTVLRFSGSEIWRDCGKCATEIYAHLVRN